MLAADLSRDSQSSASLAARKQTHSSHTPPPHRAPLHVPLHCPLPAHRLWSRQQSSGITGSLRDLVHDERNARCFEGGPLTPGAHRRHTGCGLGLCHLCRPLAAVHVCRASWQPSLRRRGVIARTHLPQLPPLQLFAAGSEYGPFNTFTTVNPPGTNATVAQAAQFAADQLKAKAEVDANAQLYPCVARQVQCTLQADTLPAVSRPAACSKMSTS